MAVRVDPSLPIHPLTVTDLSAMVDAGILGEDDHVELLDGVLVEMSPQGEPHATAVRRLTMTLAPIAAAAGLEVSPQCPLDVRSDLSRPEPDLAVVPPTPWDAPAGRPLLVIEVSVTSRRIDLGRKAAIYAAAEIPEYWVLDMSARSLIVHHDPTAGGYRDVTEHDEAQTVAASEIALTLPVATVLPPAA